MRRRYFGPALTAAVMCFSLLSGLTAIRTTAAGTATGDVDGDGAFGVTDVVLLQRWLLAVPETRLADWQAADFNADGRLDGFDLCLMKRHLLGQTVPVTEGRLYRQVGLVDPYANVVAYQGLLPEGWTVQMESTWGLIDPYPGQELVQFVSPDGDAVVSIASPLVFEDSSYIGYGADLSNFITRAPYMTASAYIDQYVQTSYTNAALIGDVAITAEQQANIDAFTEVYATEGINTAIAYSRYPITSYGKEGTIARRQYQLGDGCGEFSCAIAAYQYSFTQIMLDRTDTWWMLLPSFTYIAADKEAFDRYYADYEVIVSNGYLTAEFYSAMNYAAAKIYETVTEQRTEQRIQELIGSYSTSGTTASSSDMETQDRVFQAWDDYIKDEDTYSLGDGSTLRVPSFVDTVAQSGDSVYIGTPGGVPLGYDILTAN